MYSSGWTKDGRFCLSCGYARALHSTVGTWRNPRWACPSVAVRKQILVTQLAFPWAAEKIYCL